MSIVFYCSRHPAYQGKQKPKVDCAECAVLWEMVLHHHGRPYSWRFIKVGIDVGRRIRGRLR